MDNLPYGANPGMMPPADIGSLPPSVNMNVFGATPAAPSTLAGPAPDATPGLGGSPPDAGTTVYGSPTPAPGGGTAYPTYQAPTGGGPLMYKGHQVKITEHPNLGNAPTFPEYVVQEMLSSKDHNTVANMSDTDIMMLAEPFARQFAGTYNAQGVEMNKKEEDALVGQFKHKVFRLMPELRQAITQAEAEHNVKMGTAAAPAMGLPTALATRAAGSAEAGAGSAIAGLPGMAANIPSAIVPPGLMAVLKEYAPEVADKIKDSQDKVRAALNPLIQPGAAALKKAGEEKVQSTDEALKEHPYLAATSEVVGGAAPYLGLGAATGMVGPALYGMSEMGGANLTQEQDRINNMKPEELNALPEYQTLLKVTGDPNKAKDLLAKASSEAAEQVGQLMGGVMGAMGGGGMSTPAQMAIAKYVGTSTLKRVLATAAAEGTGFAGQQAIKNVLTTKATNIKTGEQREADLGGTDQAGIMGVVMGAIGALLHGKGKLTKAAGEKEVTGEVSPAATKAYEEVLAHPDYKVPEGASPDTANDILKEALDDLEERLGGHDLTDVQMANAKAQFTAEWRKANDQPVPMTEAAQPTEKEAAAAATPGAVPPTEAGVDNTLALVRLQKQRDAALKSGDKHAVSQIDRQIADLQAKKLPPPPPGGEGGAAAGGPPPPGGGVGGGGAESKITRPMAIELKRLGFTDEQIYKLTPDQAWDHINGNAGPEAMTEGGVTPEEAKAAAGEGTVDGGVPVMITQAMKAELKKYGYKDDFINTLTPAKAHEVILAGRKRFGEGGVETPKVVNTFKTAKGSTYDVHEDGTTTRNKAARPEHPGEEGPQPRSGRTVYVTEDESHALSAVQASHFHPGGKPRPVQLAIVGDHIGMQYTEDGGFERRTMVKFKTKPEVGLIPVEIWKDKTEHFGNKITEVGKSEPAGAGAAPVEGAATGAAEGGAAAPEPQGQPTGHPQHKPEPPKPESDQHKITHPDVDVRLPLGLLKAGLKSFRESFKREPTREELERQAKMIAKLHGIDIDNPNHDINRREALGELLDKNPDEAPAKNDITAKAGEYNDPANKRTAHSIAVERQEERNQHPIVKFREVMKKTDQLRAEKEKAEKTEAIQKAQDEAERKEAARKEAEYNQRQEDYKKQLPKAESELTAEEETAAREADLKEYRKNLEAQQQAQHEANLARDHADQVKADIAKDKATKKGTNVIKQTLAEKRVADKKAALAKELEDKAQRKAAEAKQAEKVARSKASDIKKGTPKKDVLKKPAPAAKKTAPAPEKPTNKLKTKKGEAGAAAKTKSAGKGKLAEGTPGKTGEKVSGIRSGLMSRATTAGGMLRDNIKALASRMGVKAEDVEKIKLETVDNSSLSPELQRVVQKWGEATGHRIIVFKNLTPKIFDFEGANFNGKILYVGEHSTKPATAIAVHEFVHQLKKDHPELYKELRDEVVRQGKIKEYTGHMQEARAYKGISEESAIEELVANATGEAFTDKEFLDKLAKRNPTVFGKIVDAFMKFLDKLFGKEAWQADLGTKDYLTDVDAFRKQLLDTLAKYHPEESFIRKMFRMTDTGEGEEVGKLMARVAPDVTTAAEAAKSAEVWTKKKPTIVQSFKTWKDAEDTLKPTLWQKIVQKAVNTLQPLQYYNEHMARQGTKVKPDEDIFKYFTVLRGRQIFEQSTDHSNYIAPILDAARVMSGRTKMTQDEFMARFSQWIRAKDALESNKRWELENIKLTPEADAKRAPLMLAIREEKFKGDYMKELGKIVHEPGAKLEPHAEPVSGISNAEAHQIIANMRKEGFSSDMGEEFNKSFDHLRDRITENQLRARSVSEADIRQQKAYGNKYYMPKSDWADEDVRTPHNVFGSPLGAFTKSLYGEKPALSDDPIQRIFNKLLFSSKDVADNEATGALWRAAKNPDQRLGAVIRRFDMDEIAKKALLGGKSLGSLRRVAAGRNSIIHNEGKYRYVITLPEESAQLQAIKESQHPIALGDTSKVVGKGTEVYGRVHTAFSLPFALVNSVIRDGLYIPSMMVSQGRTDLIPGYIANYVKYGGPMGAWTSAFKLEGGLKVKSFADVEKYATENPDSYLGQLYQLDKAGGGFNFRDSFNNAKTIQGLREELERAKLNPLNPKRITRYLSELQDAIATGSMMAGRVAAFVAAKEKNMKPIDAAFYAKRLLDYQQTSQGSRVLNSWFAFARVGVTSLDVMLSTLKNEKGQLDAKRAAIAMGMFGLATTSAYTALKTMLGDDKIKKISDDDLAKNVILPFGGDDPLKLPIGLGMPRLSWGVAMLATRLASGDTTAQSAGRTLKNLLLENVSPLHPIETKEGADSGTIAADLAGALVPSVARPGFESWLNQTAFGSEIHEKPEYTEGYASEAGRATTGKMYTDMARGLRTSIGLDVYPETLRHLMSSYEPGTLSLFFKDMEKEDMEKAGLDVDNSQATIFAGLFNHDLRFAAGKEFYRSKQDLEQARKESIYLTKQGKSVPQDIQNKVELDKQFVQASKEHSKARRAITDNVLLGETAKASRLAALQTQWTKIQENFSRQAEHLER